MRIVFAIIAGLLLASIEGREASKDWLVQGLIQQINMIELLFKDAYAPLEWKKERFSLDFQKEVELAKTLAAINPPHTFREGQLRLVSLLNQLRDYHVQISFASTERASLPFFVKEIGDHVYITSVEEDDCGLAVGDELLYFNGKPILSLLNELSEVVGRKSNKATDLAFAEMALTRRAGTLGFTVPRGVVKVVVRPQKGAKTKEVVLTWHYEKESCPPPFLAKALLPKKAWKKKGWMEKKPHDFPVSEMRLSPFYQVLEEAGGSFSSPFHMGAREPVISLEDSIWRFTEDSPFPAALFESQDGVRIGYLRIPSFGWGFGMHMDLIDLIRIFERESDVLILDEMGNPGGYLVNLYALLSHFTTSSLDLFQEKQSITQNDIQSALFTLELLQNYGDELQFDDLGGFPWTESKEELMASLIAYEEFILSEWNEGRTMTQLHYPLNLPKILPHLDAVYTKPLIVLTNETSVSCADLFPAVLQANKRAKIIGGETAGAGGNVRLCHFPNLFGVEQVSYTSSIIYNESSPLENQGVRPDVPYAFTLKDILHHGDPFKKFIFDEARKLVK